MTRRPFHREPEAARRQQLIRATLDCIADRGLQFATVREIAERAGVTNGLIRHYFTNKNEIMYAAYASLVAEMIDEARAAGAGAGVSPRVRLRRFVEASLAAPVLDPRAFSVWAAFISLVRVDARIAAIHREGYLAFRRELEELLDAVFRAEGRIVPPQDRANLAIAVNGLIDGLWMEGCLGDGAVDLATWGRLGVLGTERLLGLPLDD